MTGPVERLWAAIQARDWDAATHELAEDVVIDWPATGERCRGRDRYVELQRIYPEGWSSEVRAVVHEGDRTAAEIRVPHRDEVYFCAAFYEVEDGGIVRGVSTGRRARPRRRLPGGLISSSRCPSADGPGLRGSESRTRAALAVVHPARYTLGLPRKGGGPVVTDSSSTGSGGTSG